MCMSVNFLRFLFRLIFVKENAASIVVSSDDSFFVTGGSKDKTINVFDLQKQCLLYTMKDVHNGKRHFF